MKRPDIESIKSMYNAAPIVFIQGARQAVPELIEYIEGLEKDINYLHREFKERLEYLTNRYECQTRQVKAQNEAFLEQLVKYELIKPIVIKIKGDNK